MTKVKWMAAAGSFLVVLGLGAAWWLAPGVGRDVALRPVAAQR